MRYNREQLEVSLGLGAVVGGRQAIKSLMLATRWREALSMGSRWTTRRYPTGCAKRSEILSRKAHPCRDIRGDLRAEVEPSATVVVGLGSRVLAKRYNRVSRGRQQLIPGNGVRLSIPVGQKLFATVVPRLTRRLGPASKRPSEPVSRQDRVMVGSL